MKKIEMTIKHCGECPFCEYDPYYGMSYNSGYNCNNENSKEYRIVTDVGSKLADLEKLPIPEWCGLPNVT